MRTENQPSPAHAAGRHGEAGSAYVAGSFFISGLLTNMLLAGLLTFLGDRLGVDLYVAAVVAFGVRLFNNLGIIRRRLFFRDR